MEISKDYLDQQFKAINNRLDKMVTKDQFDDILNKRLSIVVTKEDLNQSLAVQTKRLQDYVHQAFETQQIFIDARFEELISKMHIVDRINRHEYWIDKLAEKIGMKPEQSS